MKGFNQQETNRIKRLLEKATDTRCEECILKKQQCRRCYSKDVTGRYPLEPDMHIIEPRGVYV